MSQCTLAGGKLDLDLDLEKSPVDELGGLTSWAPAGVSRFGFFSRETERPTFESSVSGSFNLADVHRWDRDERSQQLLDGELQRRVDSPNERSKSRP